MLILDRVQDTIQEIYLSTIIPSLSGNEESIKEAIQIIHGFDKGCHAYFGSGSARGEEIKDLPPFDKSQLFFNSLRYQLCSKKNQCHGQANNKLIDHYLPPSITRYVVVINMCLYPELRKSMIYNQPQESDIPSAISKMFQHAMSLSQPVGPRICRHVLAAIANIIFPKDKTRLSTTSNVARLFHHSEQIHDKYYSSDLFSRNSDGDIMSSDVMLARTMWKALGEQDNTIQTTIIHNPTCLDPELYNVAARFMFKNTRVHVTGVQKDAIIFADNENMTQHGFVFMGCGEGKSGIYNIPMVARALSGRTSQRTVIVSPHNALLEQHKLQTKKYFRRLSLDVKSIGMSDVIDSNLPLSFDILFISINSFKVLLSARRDLFITWKVATIFVDEYHNMFSELFRYEESWSGLKYLASLGSKIICMSATANKTIIKSTADYLVMGKYRIIGDATNYRIPNVLIGIEECTRQTILNKITQNTFEHLRDRRGKSAVFISTMSKEDTVLIAGKLNDMGLRAEWLTSDRSREERIMIMDTWTHNGYDTLVSTITDGTDCSIVDCVKIFRASRSAISVLQSAGRIRPLQQRGAQSRVVIYSEHNYGFNEQDISSETTFVQNLGLIGTLSEDVQNYHQLFTYHGYIKIIQSKQCYRQVMLDIIGIASNVCKICSICTSSNQIYRTSATALSAVSVVERKQDEVDNTILNSILKMCFVCKSSKCFGKNCIDPKGGCFKCFGRQADHTRLLCKMNTVSTHNKNCIFCFLPYSWGKSSQRVQASTTHNRQGCTINGVKIGERIKRMILHKNTLNCCKDGGASAKNTVDSCFRSMDLWYKFFHRSIIAVKSRKR